MPKQKRWSIKQDLDGAIGNIDSAMEKIFRVAKPFEHVHDDWFDKFIKVGASLHIVREVLQQLRDEI